MIGAILGDIAGSKYEFNNTLDYNFDMFPAGCGFTDDTICTVAVADAILRGIPYKDSLLSWGRRYPNPLGAYGSGFGRWLRSDNPQPYGSFGNGAAMRVSPVGFAFATEEETLEQARLSAECSHNHEEGMKGAAAVAAAIFRLRTTDNKDSVRDILHWYDGYPIPKRGQWDGTCQGCVPLALQLFLDSTDFEDAIRLAVSYGGDSDTLGAIVGGIADAYYGVPFDLCVKALSYLSDEMKDITLEFYNNYWKKNKTTTDDPTPDPFFKGFCEDQPGPWSDFAYNSICHKCKWLKEGAKWADGCFHYGDSPDDLSFSEIQDTQLSGQCDLFDEK